MAAEFKTRYDAENDILFIRRAGARSAGAVELGQIIVYFEDSQMNRAMGLEVMNASKVLGELGQSRIDRALLESIRSAKIATRHSNNMVFVVYTIRFAALPVPITDTIALPMAAEA